MAHVLAKDLRDAVLQFAVEGKLSSIHLDDSNINSLIDKLVLNPKLESSEPPFEIPEHWAWIQIGNLGKSADTKSFADGPFGSNLKKIHQIESPEVRIIQLSNVGEHSWQDDNVKYTSYEHLKTIARCEVHPGDFVIAKMMPAGRTIIMPNIGTKITLGSDVVKFVPNEALNKEYLLLAMRSNCFISQVYTETKGITRVRTSLNKIKSYYLPIPPIEEQARIVAKVNEIMSKIDEYEKLENQLVKLKEQFPQDMKDSLLQASMMGKLTEQLDSELSPFVDSKVDINEYDYDLPTNWNVVKIMSVSDLYTGNSISASIKKSKYAGLACGFNYIGTKDVGFDCSISYDNGVKIPYDESKFKIAKKNSTLLCIEGGSAGKKIGIVSEDVCFGNKLCSFNAGEHINYKFQYYVIYSPIFKKRFIENKSGMIGGVSIKKLKEILIPLPPLEEQQRIVDKLDELLPLVDKLAELN